MLFRNKERCRVFWTPPPPTEPVCSIDCAPPTRSSVDCSFTTISSADKIFSGLFLHDDHQTRVSIMDRRPFIPPPPDELSKALPNDLPPLPSGNLRGASSSSVPSGNLRGGQPRPVPKAPTQPLMNDVLVRKRPRQRTRSKERRMALPTKARPSHGFPSSRKSSRGKSGRRRDGESPRGHAVSRSDEQKAFKKRSPSRLSRRLAPSTFHDHLPPEKSRKTDQRPPHRQTHRRRRRVRDHSAEDPHQRRTYSVNV